MEGQTDTGRWKRSPFLSRRFVIGSSLAFVILAANAFLTYRTIGILVEASRAVESTLKVIGVLKDVQSDVAGAETGLRGYILSGERERLAQAHEQLGRAAQSVKALRSRPEAPPDQAQQVESADALIGEEFQRFSALIEIDRRKGMSAAIRTISATGGAATIGRVQDLVQDLLAVEDAQLTARTAQSRLSSDLSVVTDAVATFFNLGLLGVVILLARREIKERRQAEEVVKFAATHDPLTGLPNRVLLAERVNRAVAAAKSESRSTAVLFIARRRWRYRGTSPAAW